MSRPTLLPTTATGETFAGVTYHLDGELVPVLTVELQQGQRVYFEHHTLLWKAPTIDVGIKKMAGVFKRMVAGMQIFMTEATGPGPVAFSRDGVGHIFPMHLDTGHRLDVREHQFLAATDSIDFTYQFVKGVSNILFGGNGFVVDKFYADGKPGILWLHGYGNVFEVNLAANESIDVEPGAWLYKDSSVEMATQLTNLSTGLLGGTSVTLNRFTGPGRLGIQSMASPALAGDVASQVGSGRSNNASMAAGGLTVMGLLMGLLGGRSSN